MKGVFYMKHSTRACRAFAAALSCGMIFALAGCGTPANNASSSASSSAQAAITWSETLDGQKTDYSIAEAPKHAVSMSFATTEMMLQLGLEDRMAGTAFKEEDLYPPLAEAYGKVPVLAEKWPSYETLMSVSPDFVTGWETAFSRKGVPAEKLAGIPIWIPDSMQTTNADLNTLFEDMKTLGRIFHEEQRADDWVSDQKAKLAATQDKLKDLPRVRVFVFDSDDQEPFTAFEGYTTNVLKLVGADNVMAGQGVDKTWAKTSWESFVAADPECVIIVDYDTSARNDDDFQKKVDRLKNDPQLQNVTAIKQNRFIRVKLSEITPGVRTVAALERIAKELHPDMK